jgi:hypothetical protein
MLFGGVLRAARLAAAPMATICPFVPQADACPRCGEPERLAFIPPRGARVFCARCEPGVAHAARARAAEVELRLAAEGRGDAAW